MKCLKCGHDQKRGREGMTCTSCSTPFVFDPKSDSRLTDGRWMSLVERTSAHGRYPFFESQLRLNHALLGRKTSSSRFVGGLFLLISVVLGALGWSSALKDSNDLGGVLIAIISTFVLIISVLFLAMSVPGKSFALSFDKHLRRWRSSHKLEGLIANTIHALEYKPQETVEDDIYDYGVERVLLVNDPSWVDFFVLGGFHAAQRCLVLSVSGYPSYLKPQLERIIKLQPEVPIFLLHDVHDRPAEVERAARALSSVFDGKRLMNISLKPGDILQMNKIKPLVKLLHAADIDESLMVLPPQQVHSMVEAALNHRATLHELLRGERDDSSSGFIGHDGGELGAFDLMVLSDFG